MSQKQTSGDGDWTALLGWATLRNFQEMVPSKPGIPGFETSRILEEVEKVEVAVPLAIVR
jgi:hypothetical protein